VKLSAVLRQYSTSTQYRVAQSLKVCDVSILQSLQYSLYWNDDRPQYSAEPNLSRQQRPQYWSYRGSIPQRPYCLGNSVRSTGTSAASVLSRQQRLQYWNYRGGSLGNSIKRPEVPLTGPFNSVHSSSCPSKDSTPFKRSQYLSKQGQYPIEPTVLVQARTVPHSSKPF
jgi:hypothetical protein